MQILNEFLINATNIQKGLFLMIAGIGFVFAVQVIFYLIVKLWPNDRNFVAKHKDG